MAVAVRVRVKMMVVVLVAAASAAAVVIMLRSVHRVHLPEHLKQVAHPVSALNEDLNPESTQVKQEQWRSTIPYSLKGDEHVSMKNML